MAGCIPNCSPAGRLSIAADLSICCGEELSPPRPTIRRASGCRRRTALTAYGAERMRSASPMILSGLSGRVPPVDAFLVVWPARGGMKFAQLVVAFPAMDTRPRR
jgi:hypothetical protein